eukprot:16820-Pelagococcus_subviridis.AAC.2
MIVPSRRRSKSFLSGSSGRSNIISKLEYGTFARFYGTLLVPKMAARARPLVTSRRPSRDAAPALATTLASVRPSA